MWAWSRKAERGSLTWVFARLATPKPFEWTWAISFGCAVRLVPPLRRKVMCGLNFSRPHSPTWKRLDSVAVWPSVVSSCPPKLIASQSDGLSAQPSWSIFTAIERTSSGMPCRMCGIGSETAFTCAVTGSMYSAVRTTTVPRSKGPAVAGVTIARESGAPL